MIPGQLEDVRVEVLLLSGYETDACTGRDHLHWGRCWRGGANVRELPGDDDNN